MSALAMMLVAGLWAPPPEPAPDAPCTYRTYSWHTKKKKGVDHQTVKKLRSDLTAEERDPAVPECTVCREDQVSVEVEGLPKVTVCRLFADKVRAALEQTRDGGFEVRTLVGYRVGRTRGAIKDDRRSEFSNHSYGTAIDINAGGNGLYGRCALGAVPQTAKDLAGCKLRVGGAWDPKRRPKSTVREGGPAWTAFTAFWKWGGARADKVKDFMHFSPTGE